MRGIEEQAQWEAREALMVEMDKRRKKKANGEDEGLHDRWRTPEKDDVHQDNLPDITYTPGALPRNLDEAEAALLGVGDTAQIYQRGAVLVRVARIPEPGGAGGITRQAGAMSILVVEKPYLIEAATAAANWGVANRASGRTRPINAPAAIAEGLMTRCGSWRFPVLSAITECPLLLANGKVLSAPGYDVDSGVLFDPGGTVFPSVVAAPSRQDGAAALAQLLAVIEDFPFVSSTDRSVVLAAILTPMCRYAVRSAPLFAFSAPTMGTGKTLLADIVALIATGRRAAVMSHGQDETEERKRLLSVLLAGDQVIVIDNIAEPLGSDAMCSILTSETYKDRLLGVSRIVTVPTCVTWLATGNNLVLRGDLATRALIGQLDARCERPEERGFAVDLLDSVPRHRGELCAAAITVVLSYVVAGSPPMGLTTFGRFEKWSGLVRSALAWLGEADPCGSIAKVRSQDPVHEDLSALLAAWWTRFGTNPITVPAAYDNGSDELREVMLWICGDKGGVYNPRKMGRWVKRYKSRIVDGLRFELCQEGGRYPVWQVRCT